MGLSRLVLAGALLGLAAAAAVAQGLDAPIDRYREAVGSRELGAIRGRVFQERRRPSAPDLPLAGTFVVLLPRSDAWLVRLNAIKRGARESVDAYREAAPAVRRARETYEKTLLEAGAGDLPLGATVDADGVFALDGIPAGPWLLLASRSTYVNKLPLERPPVPGGPVRPPPPVLPFLQAGKLAGYSVVTYWLRELTVVAGAIEAVELTDRNAWLTGVAENIQAPRLPDQPFQPQR